MRFTPGLIAFSAIVGITILEGIALSAGINGLMLKSAFVAIGGIAGATIAQVWRKRKID